MPRSSPPLSGWFVVSLRPVGQHRPLLRLAERLGAEGISLPGLRLTAREDTPTRTALDAALRCSQVIFTSPAAVRSAARMHVLHARPHQSVLALGAGTQAALRRVGIADVLVPPHASSESLLALPELASLSGARIGIVTAPGGRDLLAGAMRERGAIPVIVHVYART
ncbi:MAG: uroporphyrinogen-III synthase, partial [Lysobacteraceae bacterium]